MIAQLGLYIYKVTRDCHFSYLLILISIVLLVYYEIAKILIGVPQTEVCFQLLPIKL